MQVVSPSTAPSLSTPAPNGDHPHPAPPRSAPPTQAGPATEIWSGLLDIEPDGYGFLRNRRSGYLPSTDDVYVSQQLIRRNGLRVGDQVVGRAATRSEVGRPARRYLVQVDEVNSLDVAVAMKRPRFEDLTPIFPNRQIKLETAAELLAPRLIDLVAPIGFGQRALLVAPPKAGKTTVLKEIAAGIIANHPEAHVMAVLVGERPEEVTDFADSVDCEVLPSTFDEPVQEHIGVAEMALNRARRLAEMGKDVVILLDSLTRLTRAYNLTVANSGRTLSGGIDPAALHPPKRFFGAARNIEEGGSLTIVATCLVETGSRLDDVIYEEFKGTGNMELVLDRKLQEQRIFPAIDVLKSATRREELLLDDQTLRASHLLRRAVQARAETPDKLAQLMERIRKTKDNRELSSLLRPAGT